MSSNSKDDKKDLSEMFEIKESQEKESKQSDGSSSYINKNSLKNLKLLRTSHLPDGNFADEEKALMKDELKGFGCDDLDVLAIVAKSREMTASEAFAIIDKMDVEQKKYVAGYLAAIMTSDGDIADSEVAMWQLISSLANLPTMTIGQAVSFWASH